MKAENAIEVHDIVKKFRVYLDKGRTLKELALFSKRRKYEEREVLKGISFEVKKGEAIGLIGHNGCGKSTMLKLLTKIMYPDSGTIEMRGRVSSLIELGAGFHPDMSGRENIYTNASIFGLTKKEIDARLDDIITFSELEEFIDNPVRTYSSGMYMRLAFSVAINVDADILLIDEILAVGDANFQAKCFNKLKEIKANGATIVIVSHSMGQIEQFCERSLWIHEGKIKMEGAPRDVHPAYLDYMGQKHQIINVAETQSDEKITVSDENCCKKNDEEDAGTVIESDKQRWGNGDARILSIKSYDENHQLKTNFNTKESIEFEIKYKVKRTVPNAVIGIGFYRMDGLHCYGVNTQIDQLQQYDLTRDGTFKIVFDEILLLPGEYELDFAIESQNGYSCDYYKKAYRIVIYSEISDIGVARLKHRWVLGIENEDKKY